MNNELKSDFLTLSQYMENVPGLDRACSTVLENSVSIFLPHKRIDKTDVFKEFIKNNQILEIEIENDLFSKVEIRGRLLGQFHKDILEILLTSPKIFSKHTNAFKVNITAYEILNRLGKSTGNKKWLIQKIDEIAECRIKIHFKTKGISKTLNFGFISGIHGRDDKELSIGFTSEYTAFMVKTEMLEYSDYVDDIVLIKNDFIKALVRYVLINKGNNSQIRISNLMKKLNYQRLISKIDLMRDLRLLRKEETRGMLLEKFGITLTSNEKTLTFNSSKNDKRHYHLQSKIEF